MTQPKTLAIRVMPGASSDRIGDMRTLSNGEEVLLVYVKAPPENNKANEAVLRVLAKHLNQPVSHLSVLKGKTSRNKLIRVKI